MTTDRPFTAAVFIATSLDGYIARADGDIGWLTSRGEQAGDTGYDAFAAGIDTLVMGRGSYEKVLTFGGWPYEGKRVAVLSTRLPEDADPRITVHRDLDALVKDLADRGARRVYADGGQVVQAFLRAGLLDELTITTVPVLLGGGLPLFGALDRDIDLVHRSTRVLGAGLVQSTYTVTHG
ncbi:dihydrofolate reductase family protein [Actinomadura rubrisoli]|uniref:Dihydrofolate reductase n=1 Tax=Actinomadura rubrisoli TaxID=2530368 RepID=A0A4R5C9Y3_9ACTN|nr:dihydrofolate reductase family protein [Actinomadura rubrisoli]TDD96688.1 dihydrofolate reductase [Actinomadura rubrisoli]